MTDKERILLTIIKKMKSTETLVMHRPWGSEQYGDNVHFAPWLDSLGKSNLKPGMLVFCETGQIHEWTMGYLVEPITDGWVLREIGTSRLCRVTNEQFTPILNMDKTLLLEGDEYLFYQKVLKAFSKGGKYLYRFGGIDMLPENSARIWIREVFNGNPDNPSIPFSFEMKWTKKTSIKSILNAMIDNGYGTKEFTHKFTNQ